MSQKISRAHWEQIRKRVQQVNFVFDPSWKCLIDGQSWRRCYDHTVEDQEDIIAQVKTRFEKLPD